MNPRERTPPAAPPTVAKVDSCTVRATQCLVGVRKAARRCRRARSTEQRIADRMQQHITVGVAEQAAVERDVRTAISSLRPGTSAWSRNPALL